MTFYSDIWVPDSMRIGEASGGWSVVMLALAFERGGEFAAQLRRLVETTAEWASTEDLTQDRRLMRRLAGTSREVRGFVVEDFGDISGEAVDIGEHHIVDAARRWAVRLADGTLVFVDDADVATTG